MAVIREYRSATEGLTLILLMSSFITVKASIEPVHAVVLGPGADAELRCLSSLEDAELRWTRGNGGDGEEEDTEIVEVENKFVINKENSSLTIKRVVESDIGKYKCSDSDSEAEVIVFAAPYVRSERSSRTYKVGDTLELTCSAWAYPSPSVTWFVGDQVVVPDGKRIKVENSTLLHNGKLTIEDVTYVDYRVYTCGASNEHGSFNGTTLVRVKSKLAWLWPIIGMAIQFALLAIIIFFYEQRKKKAMAVEKRRVDEFNKNLAAAAQPKSSDDTRKRQH